MAQDIVFTVLLINKRISKYLQGLRHYNIEYTTTIFHHEVHEVHEVHEKTISNNKNHVFVFIVVYLLGNLIGYVIVNCGIIDMLRCL